MSRAIDIDWYLLECGHYGHADDRQGSRFACITCSMHLTAILGKQLDVMRRTVHRSGSQP